MKILVLLKQTPDTEAQIKLTSDQTAIEQAGMKYVINPYDEYAVEEALQLKAKKGSGEVVIVSFAEDSVKERMLKALAMGADRAVHVGNSGLEGADSLTVAKVLAQVIKKENADVVFCGRQGIDDDNMHVHVMVAELLSWPHVNVASKLEYNEGAIKASREVEGGQVETYDVTTPAVIGAHKSLNTPRYASLPGIMKAKRKPFEKLSLEELDLNAAELSQKVQTQIVKYNYPPEKPSGKILKGEDLEIMVDKVVSYLKNEAKVL